MLCHFENQIQVVRGQYNLLQKNLIKQKKSIEKFNFSDIFKNLSQKYNRKGKKVS